MHRGANLPMPKRVTKNLEAFCDGVHDYPKRFQFGLGSGHPYIMLEDRGAFLKRILCDRIKCHVSGDQRWRGKASAEFFQFRCLNGGEGRFAHLVVT